MGKGGGDLGGGRVGGEGEAGGEGCGGWWWQYSLFQTSSMASGHHGDSWTNKPTNHDGRGSGLISP